MRNPQYSSAEYHELMREKREMRLKQAAELLTQCIDVGREFLGLRVEAAGLGLVLAEFLESLGVRRLNKLWDLQTAMQNAMLARKFSRVFRKKVQRQWGSLIL
jgi:nucleotidyltransferase/DNA polymerase involved in DNA repair